MAEVSTILNQNVTTGDSVAMFSDSGGRKHQEVVIQTQTASSDPATVNVSNPLPVQGNIASGTNDTGFPVKVGGVFNSSPPTLTNTQRGDLQLDTNGFLKVNIAAGAAAGGTSSTFGAAIPATGTAMGASDGTNMQPIRVDGSGNLKVNVSAGGVPAGTDNTVFTAGTTNGLPMLAVADNTNSVGATTQGYQGVPKMTLGRQLLVAPQANIIGGWSPFTAIAAASNNATNVKSSAGSIGYILAVNVTGTVVFLKLYNKASAPAPATDSALLVATIPIPASTSGAGVALPVPAGIAFSTGIGFAITANIATTDNTSVAANCAVVNIGYI